MPIRIWLKANDIENMSRDTHSIPETSVSDRFELRSAAKHGGYTWAEFIQLDRFERLSCYAFYRLEGMLHRVSEIKAKRKVRT